MQAGFFQLFEELEAALAGHDHVGKDEIEALVLNEFGGAEGVVADGGLVAGEAKGAGERGEGVGVVVDQEKMGFTGHADPLGRPSEKHRRNCRSCGQGAQHAAPLQSLQSEAAAGVDSASCEAESSRALTTTPDWRLGKSMRNAAPRPSSLETEIEP